MKKVITSVDSSIKLLNDVTDILFADPILGPYISNLEIQPMTAEKILEVSLFSLIRDKSTLLFTLLDNVFTEFNPEDKSQISNLIISTLSKNNNEIENKIRIKLLNSSTSKEKVGLLSSLRNYFNTLANPDLKSKSNLSNQHTILRWNGSGVHFAQMLIVLREMNWIEFPYETNNESFKSFVSNLFHNINFTSPYKSESLRRDLASDNDDPKTPLKERYVKAFAGGDFFSRMKKNNLKRKRSKMAKPKRKSLKTY